MELLKQATGANLTHIPYRGSAPAVVDLIAGQIPVAAVDITSAYPHIAAGRLIALGMGETQALRGGAGNSDDRRRRRAGLRPCRRLHRPVRAGRHAAPVVKKISQRSPRSSNAGRTGQRKPLTSATVYEDDATFARFWRANRAEVANRTCRRESDRIAVAYERHGPTFRKLALRRPRRRHALAKLSGRPSSCCRTDSTRRKQTNAADERR